MKKLLLIVVFSASCFALFSQKKSEIVQYGITIKSHYEQDIEDAEKEHKLVKEEFFDIKGDLVEVKEYDKGDLDKWFKYKYDVFGNLIEEQELNTKGEQEERVVYKFDNGLKVEKQTYDSKNRLSKSRIYKYEYRK